MRKILTFLIAITSPLILFGQSPGGVTPAAWYRADASGTLFSDAGVTGSANNTTVYQWNDVQGNGFNLLQATAGLRPTFSNSTVLANFNPTVTFQSKWMEFQPGTGINIIDRTNGTLFTAGYLNTLTQGGIFGFDSTMDYPGLHTSNNGLNNLLFFTGGPGYQGVTSNSFQSKYYFSAGANWQNGAGTNASYAAATVSLNGNRTDYSGSQLQNAVLDVNARDIRVGGDTNYGSIDGQVNEMLIFENRLSSDEMDRVESYLAIKYGTTYAQGTRDYKNSASGVVWSSSGNTGYNNNIAGIARDATGLNQKQSWSTNSGKQVLISTTGLANTNAANVTSLTVGQYLIWGDNGLAKTPTVPISGITGVNYRFASIWKVQNTGTVGTVRIAWPSGLNNLRLIQSSDAVINNTDTVTDMSVNTQTINGVTYNYADVTLADGQYFTFAAYVHAPGGVLSSLWYRADRGLTPASGVVSSWTDYSFGQVPVTPALANSTSAPSSVDGSGLNLNFNPGITFVPANALGNASVLNALSGTNFTVFTSTTPVTGSGWDRVMGLNYSNLTGGNSYDSPGLGADNVIIRTNTGAAPLFTTVATGYRYDQLTNTTIVRNSFTNTLFTRAFNGAVPGGNVTYSGITTGADGGIIFGRNANNGGDDNGAAMTMAETIVFDGTLSANDVNRVDSYLAIKGGITLDITNTPNYLSSNSTNVWNSSTNTGYNNNIFGIANDFVSDLNQKQSKSINSSQKLIIGAGGALANTNALNTNTLTDGQFLMVGDNGLQQIPAVAISGVTGINYRFASIWKAQNTGNTGTVRVAWPSGFTNLRLVQSSDAIFDNTDTITDMSVNTQTVNGVTYNYADVTLANGQYFTFAAFVQAPGGVSGPDFWVKSDDAGTIATGWKDNSLNADDIPNVGGVSLSAADRNHNFYPYTTGYSGSKFFYNSTSIMNPLGNVELPNTNTSIFSAVRPTTANGTGRITGIDDDTNAAEPGISIATGKPRQYEFFNTTTSTDFSTAFNNSVSNIFSAVANNSIANGGTSSSSGGEKILGLNGSYETTSFTGSNKFQIYGRNLRIGQSGWDAGGPFPGDIMEIAWYKRTLTPNEQSRVNSYLAIKNGVTLNENYLSTTSSVVWDRTSNTGYNNNIFGIAKDDATALHQKQAGSVNNGQKLVISTTGLADSNAANGTGIATDLQYLMIGDNGLKQGLSVPISGITGINYRFASIWKTQNTGIGTVRVAWPAGLSNLKLIQSSDAVIDNTDTITDMSVNTQTINGVSYNYTDVTLANGQFFTFAAFAHAPGGVINGLSQWYRADIDATNTGNGTDVTSWKDYFAGTISAQIAGKVLPKYKIGDATYFNYNPGINFTAITQTLGNNTTQTVTNTSNDIFTVTKEGMTSSGSPNPHFFSITADNATTDASAWDYTAFLPNTVIERRVVGGGTQLPGSGVDYSATIPSIMYNTFTNTTLARGLNGAANAATVNTAAMGLGLGGHVFGDTRWTGNSSDNGGIIGNIGETIIYGDGNLSAAERRKVDTYLAIKYGITLGRVATDNYVSSADVAIWNGALNTTYNNNVFGLAKDDISSLHQKVSKSVNAGTILTVATNNDFVSQNTTASRTALSGDQKYFLAGDNAVTATPLVGFVVASNPAQRIQRIWLSQRTNTLGNIYFSADLSAYGTGFAAGNNVRMFVADDAAFTVNVQSVAGTYSGGQWVFSKSFDSDATTRYITFGSELQPQVLWVRADKGVNTASGVPADNTQITTWYDQEIVNGAQNGTAPTVDPGESAETAATLPTLPLYRYNATDNFNFNPVVNFSNTGRGNAVQFTTPTFGTQTVISVFKAAGFGTQYYENMLLYGGDVSTPSAGDPAPARADMSFGISAGSFMSFGGGSNGDYSYLGNLGLQTQPAIGTMLRNRVGDEEVYYSTYGNGSNDILNQNADPTNTLTGEGRLLSGLVRIGKHFSAPTTLNLPDGRLNGSYAELIVYDRALSNAERAMVESYLAVKYGITLTGGTDQVGASVGNVGYDYVNSSGTVVRTSDTTYKYDVFGLGRDDYYGLNQRISKSNNAGDILTVSTNTDFTSLNLAATRTAIDGDQEYMLFANNKGSGSAVVEQTTELPSNVQRRLDREWKVAQANTDGTDISNVSLKFNLTGVTLTGATATNVMLLVDSDGDGDFTTGTVQVIPASSYTAGSAASFNNVTLTNGQVFTLGLAQGLCYKPAAIAGVGNPALNSKAGITSLNRAGTTGDNWPGIRTGGWLVLESKTKGFVPNRVAFSGANPVGIAPANFVEGMMVYDTTNKCMKMYTSQDNGATFGWYCISTQTCPDSAGGTTPITPRLVNIGYWGASGFNLFSGQPSYRSQLENTANYGPSGTFKGITGWNWINANSDVDASAATFSAAQLKAKYDIIVTGYNNMTATDAPAKIKAFTDLGGVVIVLEDGLQSAGNALNLAFGGTGNVSNGTDAQAGANAQARTLDNTVSNGVFGTGGSIIITGAQGQAVPPVANIPLGSFIAAYMNYPTNTSVDYAGVSLTGTGNRAIFVYDEGIFRASSVSGTVIDTPQEIFIHNLMSYALQAVGFSPN